MTVLLYLQATLDVILNANEQKSYTKYTNFNGLSNLHVHLQTKLDYCKLSKEHGGKNARARAKFSALNKLTEAYSRDTSKSIERLRETADSGQSREYACFEKRKTGTFTRYRATRKAEERSAPNDFVTRE